MNNTEHAGAKLLHSRKSAALTLSISLRTIDNLIATKQIATVRIGKRVLISEHAIRRFIRTGQGNSEHEK